jgi:Spy/CpxP family protein refolding chaperone
MSPLRPLRTLALSCTVLLLVSACASDPVLPPAQSYDGRDEKGVLAVLRNVEATDPQREKILASYDKHNPTLLKLAQEWRELRTQWGKLDRKDPGFAAAAEAIASRRMAVAGEQIREAASFEQEIVAVLTPEQWKDWQELWLLIGDPQELCGGPGGGFRRRGR